MSKSKSKKNLPDKLPKIGSKKHIDIKHRESINVINKLVRYKLAPSEIHGVGVFATEDIKKGDILYMDSQPNLFDLPYSRFKRLNKQAQETILGQFPLIPEGSHFIYPTTRFTAFLNHSDKPNYDAINDKALCDIKEGEEITENYKKIKGIKKIMKDYPEVYNFIK